MLLFLKKLRGCYSVDGVKTMMREIWKCGYNNHLFCDHMTVTYSHVLLGTKIHRKAEWYAREDAASCAAPQALHPSEPALAQLYKVGNATARSAQGL